MEREPKTSTKYISLILLSWGVLVTFRIIETALVVLNYGWVSELLRSEVLGLLWDFVLVNVALLLAFPVYLLLNKFSLKVAGIVFLSSVLLISISHFFILKYFLYQLKPLDIFVFQYSLQEILFTVKTSDISLFRTVFLLLSILVVFLSAYYFLLKQRITNPIKQLVWTLLFLSLPVVFVFQFILAANFNGFSQNKSFSFYANSVQYLLKGKSAENFNFENEAERFQLLHPEKTYINSEFPLLHKFETDDVLAPFFKRFDNAPNIVILIVEGLSDDFIHDFHGVKIMPFLGELKSKSLYWNRCFTLGERSFAAVPSILGSLPYGEKGFTLLDKYPKHFSLVSVLGANNYFTSFFYGQGSWFHKKDRFFEYNNIGLNFDNAKFDKKYDKIIVGDDNFFWGYNDKDLFRQSLEVIDTMGKQPRLDVYFTGTSHAPFQITDPEKYEQKFNDILSGLTSNTEKNFFETYKKYILSLLFVDDALESFINDYKQIDGFENTIFIVTGDHPMTEIPIGNSLKRYHVPLIFYSEKVKQPKVFSGVCSHLDIYETLLSLLENYGVEVPKYSSALGNKLPVEQNSGVKRMAFMNDNREIIDYYSADYYLLGETLFEVDENFGLTKTGNEQQLQTLKDELNNFRKISGFASLNDRILPDTVYHKGLKHREIFGVSHFDTVAITAEYHNLVDRMEVKNGNLYFDVAFNYSGEIGNEVSLVYQLTNAADSVLLWQSNVLESDNNSFDGQFRLPAQNIPDSILYFQSFLWNRGSATLSASGLQSVVWEE